jgi:hypothetical protein
MAERFLPSSSPPPARLQRVHRPVQSTYFLNACLSPRLLQKLAIMSFSWPPSLKFRRRESQRHVRVCLFQIYNFIVPPHSPRH